MDYLNVAYSEERLVYKEEKEIDGIVYHITRWTDDKHFYKKIVIDDVQAEGPFEFVEKVAKFTLSDFEDMFGCSSLHLEKIFGDYQLNEYDHETSPRLILAAKKSEK